MYNRYIDTISPNFYENLEKSKMNFENECKMNEEKVKHYSMKIEDAPKQIDKIVLQEDPTGLPPNAPGAKLDAGKPDLDLVLGAFAGALLEVGKVGTFGAKKYSEDGWLKVPNGIRRYTSAELRHYFYEADGEKFDVESGLLHKAHKAWNALAALQLELNSLREGDEGDEG